MSLEDASKTEKDQFRELKQLTGNDLLAVNSQLDNIFNEKSGSTLKWLATIVLSIAGPTIYSEFSVLNVEHIFLAWVPTSFIVFLFIIFLSLGDQLRKYLWFKGLSANEVASMKKATEGVVKHTLQRDWGKSASPLIYSMMLIFTLTLALLIASVLGAFSFQVHFIIFLPILISFVMVVGGIGGLKFKSIEDSHINNRMSYITKGVVNVYSNEKSKNEMLFAISLILKSITEILPFLLAIWLTAFMIQTIDVFIVILVSQILFFLTIGSILSRSSAIDYLQNVASSYQQILSEIDLILLNKKYTGISYEELEKRYLKTKKYDVRRDSSLRLLVYYMYDTNVKYVETNPELK